MLTKKEFVDSLAERYGITKKDATAEYEDVFGMLEEFLQAGQEVAIVGLGRFKVSERAARVAHNPRTGETVEVPAKKVIKLQLSKSIKDAVAEL